MDDMEWFLNFILSNDKGLPIEMIDRTTFQPQLGAVKMAKVVRRKSEQRVIAIRRR